MTYPRYSTVWSPSESSCQNAFQGIIHRHPFVLHRAIFQKLTSSEFIICGVVVRLNLWFGFGSPLRVFYPIATQTKTQNPHNYHYIIVMNINESQMQPRFIYLSSPAFHSPFSGGGWLARSGCRANQPIYAVLINFNGIMSNKVK